MTKGTNYLGVTAKTRGTYLDQICENSLNTSSSFRFMELHGKDNQGKLEALSLKYNSY